MSELPPPGRYRAVSTNGIHACALTEDGEAVCWGGWNEFGEIEPPPGRYVAISVGRRLAEGPHPANSCALTADGAVVCWGFGVAEATDGGEAQHLDGHPALRFEGPYSSVVSPAGTGFCAVSVDGEAECWSDWPVSGDAPTPFEDLPKATTVADSDNDVRYTAVSASASHVCAITVAGHAVCRTDTSSGRFDGTVTVMNPPDPAPDRYIAIGVGWEHGCALTQSGEVVC